MKMPYGKFKGNEINQLPSSYLRWVAESWKEDTPQNKAICEAADNEWQHREKHGMHFNEVKENGRSPTPGDGVYFRGDKGDDRLCPHCGGLVNQR